MWLKVRSELMNDARLDRLRALIDPSSTSVVTMELQRGVVGDRVTLPALRDECLATGTIVNAARVCAAARAAGARVVHCTAEHRADGAGFLANCRIFNLAHKQKAADGHFATEIGTPGAELVPELGAEPNDVVVSRMHGMSPFMSTSLDQMLRNMNTKTVIACGVSLNLGIFGLALNAVDLGYQVIVVRDAVAGVPAAYAEAVLENSIAMLATIVTTDELLAAWAG
jgi:biuret amidohydrolase